MEVKDGVQIWTVPISQRYTIKAYGSAGGAATGYDTSFVGRGGVVQADFNLKKGEKIRILVGQNGLDGKNIVRGFSFS